MKKKLKIAIFHLGFFFSGGGEKLVLEEARGLERMGHKVSLFAPVIDKKKCFPDLIKNFKVHSLFFPFSFNFPLRDFIAIAGSVFLTPLTFWRFNKFDILFAANQPGPLICYFLSRILGKPYVVYLSQPTRLIYPRRVDLEVGFGKGSFDIFYLLARIFRPIVVSLDQISIRNSNAILADGDYMAGILKKIYKRKVVVCPAGCYPKNKLVSFKSRGKDKIKINRKIIKKPYILITNRHYPQKKIAYAIQALSLLDDSFANVSLTITGASTGHTRYLKQLVSRLSLKKRVIFTGLVSEKDLDRLYSHSFLYLYTSPEEDFGMGIIEAMAAATPVVAWDHAGPTVTVINKVTGYLAEPYQLGDYLEKITRILTNPKEAEKMGLAGNRRVKEKFSYQIHNQVLEETLKGVWGQVPDDYYQSANLFQRVWHGKKWQTVTGFLTGKEKRVLDVGCASGYSTSQIGRAVPKAKITGIDINPKLIVSARKRYPRFRFKLADGQNLPFRNNSFDTVVCTEVVEHLVSPQKGLREMNRVLAPGGKLILEVDTNSFLFRSIWFFWTRFSKGRTWQETHLHHFAILQLERLIRKAGFKIKRKVITHLGMAVTFLVLKER